MHPIPGMVPPLMAEEEGPPTYKELNLVAIHVSHPKILNFGM
jgi:hypothetical protein